MKPILLPLIALVSPAHAALLGHVETTRGTVVVELQYDKAPQAVANFITLAEGTRLRIDPATGAPTRAPLYIGETFYRVVNDTTFKIVQTGSGTGTNKGGPGFTFRDEFHPSLTHVPHVLSMANGGFNTNGSQIFFTGNATIPGLDDVHTVFGLVTDGASRAVIDAIHAAGNDATTITAVSFTRTDPAAEAFDEHAQGLPVVSRSAGKLSVVPGGDVTWLFDAAPAPGSVFHAWRSSTLEPGGWLEMDCSPHHFGQTAAQSQPVASGFLLETGAAPKAFYHLSVVKDPGSLAPSSLANRTVTIPLSAGSLILEFDATGDAGTTTYQPLAGTAIGGPFTRLSLYSEPHRVIFIADTPALNPRYLEVTLGCDSATETLIHCRHSTESYGIFGWQPFASGAATLSR